ncbi:Inosine-uridine preferring nucleoside hydrolase [Cohnella sp. OV330]|uniref:nucleoside hydrolase n=1 Tax=Cohnella sp. OV330 TaxID=1855288 RepID=UPI0008E11AC7|nr:nucleoside hydrolase [Cohnella sp. OV330]SFB58349.1 Inosine-uridine preferring nucleoside hydrolase [Cohnella sp. OV330]
MRERSSLFSYQVPDAKRVRYLMNTDAKNEADDQYAIVHALLTPQMIHKGMIAAHFGTGRTTESMDESYAEIKHVLSLMGSAGHVPVYKGAAKALPDEQTPVVSEGAEAIIREALSDDSHPLFVVFLGPLTDLASAYLMEPRIADRMTAIWIGGGPYPHGRNEFNLSNDIHAANVVMGSRIPLWQVPQDVYGTMRVSLAELECRVKPYGAIGKYLFEQLVRFNEDPANAWPRGEVWGLGDSPAVSLILDDLAFTFGYETIPAPRITPDMHYVHHQTERTIRVYKQVDVRFTLEDMYAKLTLFATQQAGT